jgi:hypothetical protein
MLVLNTAQLRVEQNKLLKAFNRVSEGVSELGITGKDKEDIDAILAKHFEKKLSKLIEEHKCLPEEMGREEKEAPGGGEVKQKAEPVKPEPQAAATNGVAKEPAAQTDDIDAF